MGKKVSPHSLRIGITRTWDSRWYSKRGYKDNLLQDIKIREYIFKKLKRAGIGRVEITRNADKTSVIIHAGKPGIIIGRGGDNISVVSKDLRDKFDSNFDISVKEIGKPDGNAQLIAESVSEQVARRFPYRRVVKMAVERAKEAGVKGAKITVSGRLNGVDISRKETYGFGTVPLHTLRANIDYATARSETTYGTIGVKVWVYHGLVFKNKVVNEFMN